MECDDSYTPIWYIFPKKELLSTKKINTGVVRTIQAPPMDYLLACSSVFFMQNAEIMSSGLFCVGDTLEYGGFSAFCKKLSKFTDFLEIDGKKFDKMIHRRVMKWVRNVRARMHTCPEIVRFLYRHIIDFIATDGAGHIYGKDHGNPSGSYNTIIDNCIASLFYLAYVVIRSGMSFIEYWENTINPILGDDIFCCMRGEYIITFEQFTKYAAEVGMTYELARESGDLIGHSFFGKTIDYDPIRKKYFGHPNYDKLFAHLCYLPGDNVLCQSILDGLYAHLWVNKKVRLEFQSFVEELGVIRDFPFILPNDSIMDNLVFGMEGW
jgi:hypothetical protein